MENITTDMIKTAAYFVNSTASHIFLTGKAGTGKTTFLRQLGENTHKRFVIVAPTGIAALNAGGVTIHSQFLLPLGTFLPDKTPSGNFSDQSHIYTQYTLTRKHPINSIRKQVLRSIDLLIIDEVSMLRADVLDAIDHRLRSAKGNFRQSFGGVQVLMIGDLFQLPPIVKDHEWSFLKRYYHSAHFFEAKALQTDGFVYIELDKIFRQSDNKFITILNNLRDNKVTQDDITELNKHYRTDIVDDEEVIALTTHNYKAEEINQKALNRLPGSSFVFRAVIADEFPENIFPLPEKLELKVGAQLMFVKNDTSGQNKYFNGKLARVVSVDQEEIIVEMAGSHEKYRLEREQWENKKYQVNASSKELDEEVIGTFSQFPVKLAWAVTVHKSQGLTFDKAIIDVGSAFAPGQVYVALSRLRSLDGLILKTRIDPSVINSDALVVEFSNRKNLQRDLNDVLKEKQMQYAGELLDANFDFSQLVKELSKLDSDEGDAMEFEDESMKSAIKNLLISLRNEENNTAKFRYQLKSLLMTNQNELLNERLSKGTDYYLEILKRCNKSLIKHIEQVRHFSGHKSYISSLSELDQLFTTKIDAIEKTQRVLQMILTGADWTGASSMKRNHGSEREKWMGEIAEEIGSAPMSTRKSGKVKKPSAKKASPKTPGEKKPAKKERGSTVIETISLYREGKTVEQIAAERGFVKGTIEGHLAKATEMGIIRIQDWIEENELTEITNLIPDMIDETTMSMLYSQYASKYSHAKIRAALEHHKAEKTA